MPLRKDDESTLPQSSRLPRSIFFYCIVGKMKVVRGKVKPSASLSSVKTTSQKTVGKAAAESIHVAEKAAAAASIHVSMLLIQH